MLEEPVKLECFFFTFKKEMKDINVSLIDRCTIRTYSLWCFVLILHSGFTPVGFVFNVYKDVSSVVVCFESVWGRTACGFFCFELV